MDVEGSKALLRRFDAEVWNGGDVDLMDELFAVDYVNHDPSLGQTPDREGHKATVRLVRDALPDLRETVEDLFGEGDRVVFSWSLTATHLGSLLGVTPTGRPVHVRGIEIYRTRDGQIAERWGCFDRLGLMQQLGIIDRRER